MIPAVVPPTPTPSDDNLIIDMGGGLSSELLKRKEIEARKKIFEQDEEDCMIFIHNLIISQNLN